VLGGSNEATIAAGLKEALQIGAERSVSQAARPGGFLENSARADPDSRRSSTSSRADCARSASTARSTTSRRR
jgi:hypothetical protein